jgi:glycosyltransferase involved in cell wall biosynthesis
VGSLIERKRLLSVVQALATFKPESRPALVVIGKGREYKRRVVEFAQAHGMENHILFVPHVAFSDFPAVYQAAMALVYPSIAEGFGIPVIEALFSKIPVVTSNRSCLPEAAGPNSLLVNPDNIEEFAHALERVVSDAALRNNMIDAGHSYVQRFHEDVVTKQVMSLYTSLTESSHI